MEKLRPAIGKIERALEDLNQESTQSYGRLILRVCHTEAAAGIAPI
jgi:hypothetical protein